MFPLPFPSFTPASREASNRINVDRERIDRGEEEEDKGGRKGEVDIKIKLDWMAFF